MPAIKLASPLLVLVLLSACAKETIVATAEPLCESVRQVCISRGDVLTEGTASQVEANNLARTAVCKPKGDPCADVRVKPSAVKPAAPKAPDKPVAEVDAARARRVAGL